jgi:putative proteasome-type protease
VGRLGREVAEEHREAMAQAGADGTATFILGGQVQDEAPDIMLVFPEGNYIRASEERPFLQIGESKYGKFMLDWPSKPTWTSTPRSGSPPGR